MRAKATVMGMKSGTFLVIPRVFAQSMGFTSEKTARARWTLVVGSQIEPSLKLVPATGTPQINDMSVRTFARKRDGERTVRGESTIIRIPSVVAVMLGWKSGTKVEWVFTGPEQEFFVERVRR